MKNRKELLLRNKHTGKTCRIFAFLDDDKKWKITDRQAEMAKRRLESGGGGIAGETGARFFRGRKGVYLRKMIDDNSCYVLIEEEK